MNQNAAMIDLVSAAIANCPLNDQHFGALSGSLGSIISTILTEVSTITGVQISWALLFKIAIFAAGEVISGKNVTQVITDVIAMFFSVPAPGAADPAAGAVVV
jgi:hypothetical protein